MACKGADGLDGGKGACRTSSSEDSYSEEESVDSDSLDDSDSRCAVAGPERRLVASLRVEPWERTPDFFEIFLNLNA